MSRLISRISRVVNEPFMVYYFLRSRVDKDRLYRKYSELSFRSGIRNLKFVLSFDCDTIQDIRVVEAVNKKLNDLGIPSVYAVPGELLEEGGEVYRKIRDTGAEFINHGYKTHSLREGSEYRSTFDYKDIPFAEVEADILQGHAAIEKTLGIQPRGFRTPHFGNFQKRSQLEYLYSVLRSLHYDFSTSTIPFFGFMHGAYLQKSGLAEIPVSGLISEPLRIYDSFLFFDNNTGSLNGSAYQREGFVMADYYATHVKHGIINIYADPSQVYNCDEFFRVMEKMAGAADCTTYSKIVDEIERYHADEIINHRV